MTLADRTLAVRDAPRVGPAPLPNPDPTVLRKWLEETSAAAAVVPIETPEAEMHQWYGHRLAELIPQVEYVQHSERDHFELLQQFLHDALQHPAGQQALQTSLALHHRVLLWLTAHNRRGDVLLVLADLQDNGRSYPTKASANSASRLAASPPYLPQLSEAVDPALLGLTAVDLAISARLTRFAWGEGGILELGGWAYLPGIDPEACVLELGLLRTGSDTTFALAVCRDREPRIDIAAGDRWNSYAEAAFTATVDPRDLPGIQASTGGSAEWAVQMKLRFGDLLVSDTLRVKDIDLVPRRLPVGPLGGDRTRVIGLMDSADGLKLKAVRYSCMATAVSVARSTVQVGFRGSDGPLPAALYLETAGESPIEFHRTDSVGSMFTADLGTASGTLGKAEKRWTVKALLPNGRTEPLAWSGAGTDLAAGSDPAAALRAECTGYGYLQISLRTDRLTVNSADLRRDDGTLILEGRLSHVADHPEPEPPQLLLRTARNEIKSLATTWLDDHGQFRAVFPLFQDKWGHGTSALETGHYRVLRAAVDETGHLQHIRVPALGQLLGELPLQAQHELIGLEVVGEGNEQDLVLRVSAPRSAAERTELNRGLLVSGYSRTSEAVDQRSVLFETFDGKSCSDSGRAISDVLGEQLPGLHRYWTVADFSVPVPAGCKPVLRESSEWFRLLATAGYLVNNNNFPHYFRKRPGQFYLQTWHGTPLKRIGADTPITGSTASYRALIKREAAAWDMLLTQNEFAAETLAAAFGYRGEPAVFGYPRNDALSADTAAARRVEVRRRLGIDSDRKVLLYMPTWRDNGAAANPYLNFEAAAEQLGPDYVLLYRGHHKIAGQRKTTGQDCYVDVTVYPQISDLYLAADLLVTDYSSAMFDFCVTGKPMFFLAADIAHYRDSERGFYFDFEGQAPGPVAENTKDLLAMVRSHGSKASPHIHPYPDFVQRYAPIDDGEAAVRVVMAVWDGDRGV